MSPVACLQPGLLGTDRLVSSHLVICFCLVLSWFSLRASVLSLVGSALLPHPFGLLVAVVRQFSLVRYRSGGIGGTDVGEGRTLLAHLQYPKLHQIVKHHAVKHNADIARQRAAPSDQSPH